MKRQLLYKIFSHIATNKSLEDFLKLINETEFRPEIIEKPYIEVYLHNSASPTYIPTEQSRMTAIHIAAKNGRLDILELFNGLYEDINYDVETTSGWTPLMYASRYDKPEVIQFLLAQKVKYNKTNYDNELSRKHASKKLADTKEIFALYPLQEDNAASIAITHNNPDCFKLLYPLEKKILEDLAKQYNRKDMLKSIVEENDRCHITEEEIDSWDLDELTEEVELLGGEIISCWSSV